MLTGKNVTMEFNDETSHSYGIDIPIGDLNDVTSDIKGSVFTSLQQELDEIRDTNTPNPDISATGIFDTKAVATKVPVKRKVVNPSTFSPDKPPENIISNPDTTFSTLSGDLLPNRFDTLLTLSGAQTNSPKSHFVPNEQVTKNSNIITHPFAINSSQDTVIGSTVPSTDNVINQPQISETKIKRANRENSSVRTSKNTFTDVFTDKSTNPSVISNDTTRQNILPVGDVCAGGSHQKFENLSTHTIDTSYTAIQLDSTLEEECARIYVSNGIYNADYVHRREDVTKLEDKLQELILITQSTNNIIIWLITDAQATAFKRSLMPQKLPQDVRFITCNELPVNVSPQCYEPPLSLLKRYVETQGVNLYNLIDTSGDDSSNQIIYHDNPYCNSKHDKLFPSQHNSNRSESGDNTFENHNDSSGDTSCNCSSSEYCDHYTVTRNTDGGQLGNTFRTGIVGSRRERSQDNLDILTDTEKLEEYLDALKDEILKYNASVIDLVRRLALDQSYRCKNVIGKSKEPTLELLERCVITLKTNIDIVRDIYEHLKTCAAIEQNHHEGSSRLTTTKVPTNFNTSKDNGTISDQKSNGTHNNPSGTNVSNTATDMTSQIVIHTNHNHGSGTVPNTPYTTHKHTQHAKKGWGIFG